MKTFTCCSALFAVASAFAQDVPPPPRPDDAGPTMEFTMEYIQDKLNGLGQLKLEEGLPRDSGPDAWNNLKAERISEAVADPSSCTLSFRKVQVETSESSSSRRARYVVTDWSNKLRFQDLTAIQVYNYADVDSLWHLAMYIVPSSTGRFYSRVTNFASPSEYDAQLGSEKRKKKTNKLQPGTTNAYASYIPNDSVAVGPVIEKDPEEKTVVIEFREEDPARRMAKAMVRAVELCGGGGARDDKDPFK